jgi:hypothetical protein
MSNKGQDRINRIIELARIMRQRENQAAAAGDYLLAIVYNRAHFRAVKLALALHYAEEIGGYRMTAINLNEYYAVRMPWTPNSTMRVLIHDSGRGGQN